MTRRRLLLLTGLLGLMTTLEPFSIDMSLPPLPAMAADLGVAESAIQFSLSAFFLGMAVGQLVYGPASDRIGRRPPLLAGLLLYVVATLACAFADSADALIVLRGVQGFAAASGQVLARAIVRDRFDREDAARLFSYVFFILGLAPVVAPILGAHFAVWFGWPSIFVFLAVYGGIVLALNLCCLDESLAERDPDALRPAGMARNYLILLGNRAFVGNMLCGVFAFCALFAFLAASPTVIISFLGQPPETFGYLLALTMSGHLAALTAGARLVGRVGLDPLLRIGSMVGAGAGAALALLAWTAEPGVAAIVLPVACYLAAFGWILPQAMAGALQPFPRLAGAASSLLGFLQLLGAAATAAAVSSFDDGTQTPMTTAIFLASLGGALAYLALVRPRRAPFFPRRQRRCGHRRSCRRARRRR